MRDIKFRGFNYENGWIYGMYVDNYIVDEVVEATNEYIALGRWCHVDIDTVGQYTGLKDRNGTEIYEGDILECKGHYSGEGWFDTGECDYHFISSVKWDNVKSSYKCGGFDLSELYVNNDVIVGNIFENPELENSDVERSI